MSDYAWSVHQGGTLRGTAELDHDLVWSRLIAGKAVYRADTERRDKQGNPTHPLYAHLARKLVVGQTLVNRDNPDMPMQVHKAGPRAVTSTMMTEETAARIPMRFRLADDGAKSTKYNTDHLSRSVVRSALDALDEKLRKPMAPHASFSPEAAFSRLIGHYNRTYLPLRSERDRLSAELATAYAEIAGVLDINQDDEWTLTHTATGLVIEIGDGMRSTADAMRLYRRHLIKTRQESKLVTVERRVPARVTISQYKPNPEAQAELDGLAAYGD